MDIPSITRFLRDLDKFMARIAHGTSGLSVLFWGGRGESERSAGGVRLIPQDAAKFELGREPRGMDGMGGTDDFVTPRAIPGDEDESRPACRTSWSIRFCSEISRRA